MITWGSVNSVPINPWPLVYIAVILLLGLLAMKSIGRLQHWRRRARFHEIADDLGMDSPVICACDEPADRLRQLRHFNLFRKSACTAKTIKHHRRGQIDGIDLEMLDLKRAANFDGKERIYPDNSWVRSPHGFFDTWCDSSETVLILRHPQMRLPLFLLDPAGAFEQAMEHDIEFRGYHDNFDRAYVVRPFELHTPLKSMLAEAISSLESGTYTVEGAGSELVLYHDGHVLDKVRVREMLDLGLAIVRSIMDYAAQPDTPEVPPRAKSYPG